MRPGLKPRRPSKPYVGWVEFVVGSLPCTERYFFYHLIQNQPFQIPILDLERTPCLNEFIRTPKYFVGKQIKIHFVSFLE